MVWPTNNKQEFCHGLKKEHRLLWLIDDIRFQYPFENHYKFHLHTWEERVLLSVKSFPFYNQFFSLFALWSGNNWRNHSSFLSLSLSRTNFHSLKQVPTIHVTMSMTSSCPAKHLVNICKFCKWKKEWETVLLTRPIWGHN